MRGALIAGLVVTQGMWAQALIDGSRIPANLRNFTPDPQEERLRCDVTPVKPSLDFGFRFQTGYNVAVPMSQYAGAKHGWATVTRVTPEHGAPAYLSSRVFLPDVPVTKITTHTFGGFLVGPGKYRVDWVMIDDRERVCRKSWTIEAKLTRSERQVEPAIPPDSVRDFGVTMASRRSEPTAPDAPPFRLTVLLHAAPATPRRIHMRANDRILLLSTLSALVERAHATSVRVAVFNLEKQRVLYRRDDFRLRMIGDVSRALNRLELDTIDVQTLQNRHGHIGLLESLIAEETTATQPADAVVFLGPAARFLDKPPSKTIQAPPEGMRFYYFQYRPFASGMQPVLPDSIAGTLAGLKGRVFHIYSPKEFASAISELDKLRR